MARPRPASLLRRLLTGFMLVMLAIWACALAHIAYQARGDQQRQSAIVNRAWTRQIMLNMVSMAQQPAGLRKVGAAIEQLRRDMFSELGFPTDVRTTIWKNDQLVYDSAPGQAAGEGWVSWVERDASTGIVVRRSEKSNADWMFTASAASYLLTPLAYSLPFLLLPAWFIVRVGLRPLRAIVAEIEQRTSADLAPLPASPFLELAPLVEATNRLMMRLQARIEREQEFLSDAAHELKTPLSVIQINAHLLASVTGAGQRGEALAGLREGVSRASHTVHQLLAFERVRCESGSAEPGPLDLARLLRDRLALAAPLAILRNIEIELEAERPCVMPLHRESLTALLDNIIGNAIKYSPDAGRIGVLLADGGHGPRLVIHDQGPGIAPALRKQAFERFYRIPGQSQEGSGLGLAIAERAAARNGAVILLDDGAAGRGLTVIVDFTKT